jgi:hypothetical protein
MLLSPKAKQAADKLKSFDEDDVHSISEMIQHEVQHATELLSKRAKAAEARVRELADHAQDDLSRAGETTKQAITDHPLPAGLAALGIGLILGMFLTSGRR